MTCTNANQYGHKCLRTDKLHSSRRCVYSMVAPIRCPNGHWLCFRSPTAMSTACKECGVKVKRSSHA